MGLIPQRMHDMENQDAIRSRIRAAADEDLEQTIVYWEGRGWSDFLGLVRLEYARRQKRTKLVLNGETRFIAYAALLIAAVQLFVDVWPPASHQAKGVWIGPLNLYWDKSWVPSLFWHEHRGF